MARISMERRLELPPAIVWDALVDPVLVEGWLHPELRLVDDAAVIAFDEPTLLAVESVELGALRFELAEVQGGSRDVSTTLRLELVDELEPAFLSQRIAAWRTRLDQLEDLLRGHPVDWDHWERDRGEDYAAHLAAVRAAARHS